MGHDWSDLIWWSVTDPADDLRNFQHRILLAAAGEKGPITDIKGNDCVSLIWKLHDVELSIFATAAPAKQKTTT